ncbi:DUF799 domain-containing protein [Biostraticola tofi]|uniref:Lipoprotein n=1 Tax=Biostraticola tofi TaxID=466109 RepID=A0A4V2W4B1_9GAMM|nr:DUF799 domain-containing protein [Biostraticola tofi]TCV95129.1 hypothetical protein EDC52_10660 [Biostraticola tofi]
MNRIIAFTVMICALMLAGCAAPVPYDYTELKKSKPKSILVLPPINESPDINAGPSMLTQITQPLSEAGYYVLPVAVVDETFKQNGLTESTDIHALSTAKLQQIFGADAVMYVKVVEYGTSYMVISSDTRVTATATLVDLRSGALLWSGKASASSSEDNNHNNSNNLIAMLITAAVKQISSTIRDEGHTIAGITSNRMLSAGHFNGILYGPRSPLYGKDDLKS